MKCSPLFQRFQDAGGQAGACVHPQKVDNKLEAQCLGAVLVHTLTGEQGAPQAAVWMKCGGFEAFRVGLKAVQAPDDGVHRHLHNATTFAQQFAPS
jgi:hypothetical protein